MNIAATIDNVALILRYIVAIGAPLGTLLALVVAFKNARRLEKEIELLKLQTAKAKDDRIVELEDKYNACLEGRLTDSQMRRPTN